MQRKGMKMMFAAIAFVTVSSAAYAAGPLPPASEILPKEFKVLDEQNMPNAMSTITATSAKNEFEKATKIQVTWQMNPMADRTVEMIASQPEKKAKEDMTGKEEPCGKSRHRGGVLTCRVYTGPPSDMKPHPYTKVQWQGTGSNGLLSVTVDSYTMSKQAATDLVDSMITKITKAK